MVTTEKVTIAGRFNGPPAGANGGYACGAIAERARELLDTPDVAVTLHLPIPLDVPLTIGTGSRVHVWHDDALLATAAGVRAFPGPPAFVPVADAAAAECRFAGDRTHPFPTCFVCGTERAGDGLGLRPGVIPDRPDTAACTWRPDKPVSEVLTWAALDCPGGWSIGLSGGVYVLSRMAARIVQRPKPGGTYVIVGTADRVEGRSLLNRTALYDADGSLLASAAAVWLRLAS